MPTGLVDTPFLTPVTPHAVERRRSWPLAAAIVLVAVMGGGALFMSGYSVGRDVGLAPGSAVSDRDAFQPFWDVYNAVTTRYPLGPVERTTLIEGAIRGLVEAVGDPYSSYLSPEDFTGTLNDISGTFEGIGAEIGSVDLNGNASDCATFGPECHLVIIAPIDGSPAEEAGLKPGDVDPHDRWLDARWAHARRGARSRARQGRHGGDAPHPALRGAACRRPTGAPAPSGSAAPRSTQPPRQLLEEFDVKLVRAKIQRREVTSRVLAGGTVGYISLSGFSGDGAKQLKAALQTQLDSGIKKIVFDLRGNPGGFIVDARDVASQFIADGPVYWLEDAQGKQTATDATSGGIATDPSIQVVVLIDRGSASASEIVAGALQDRGRAQADRRDVVRQGHRPGMAAARRARRREADRQQVADARQALDPQGRPHARCRRHGARRRAAGRRSGARQGARGARARRRWRRASCCEPPEGPAPNIVLHASRSSATVLGNERR